MVRPDQNQVLRRLPIVVGALGGTLLFLNRIMTPDLSSSQSRADALGVILSAVLILIGLLWQRIQPKIPESVVLEGEQGFELAETLPQPLKTELAWASHLLLTNTVTRSVIVFYAGKTLLRRGVLPPVPPSGEGVGGGADDIGGDAKDANAQRIDRSEISPGTIIQRVLDRQSPVYLVNLSIYPGRVEFDYLPTNTQGVICQPLGDRGVLILGANAPRSYTQQDEAWIAGIAEKLSNTLQTCWD